MIFQPTDKSTHIYGLCDPRTGELRYVGKTTQPLKTRLHVHVSHAKNRFRAERARHAVNWVKGLLAEELRPEIFVIETIPPYGDWADAEQFWIEYFKSLGSRLCNLRPGGEYSVFGKQSPEWVEKRASKLRGRKGRPQTDEEKQASSRRLTETNKRRAYCKASEETKRRMSQGKKAMWAQRRSKGVFPPNCRKIAIGDQIYPGVLPAARQVGVCIRTMRNWLASGKAKYAD